MNLPVEREYKILLTREQYDKLLHSYEFPIVIDQTNHYMDTPDDYIRSLGGAMRLRDKDGKVIFTLKTANDDTSHIELEKELDPSIGRDFMKDPEIRGWLEKYHIPADNLISTYEVHTIRHICEFPDAEFCLDETCFGKITDYEMEFEMKEDKEGIEELNQILRTIGMTFEKNSPSKVARAAMYSQLNL